MSFDIALTGLNAVTKQLDSISNNISNVGTTGFKSSRAEFGSVYADSQAMGVDVIGQTQSINKGGSLASTGRNLDVAISGGGFFVTRNPAGDIGYTRAGVFGADKDSFIVNGAGQRLQGYSVNADGELQVGSLGDLQLRSANLPARATDSLEFVMNLDSNETAIPAATAFNKDDAATFNSTYTSKVFDSQGKEHTLTQYFVKTDDNAWDVHYFSDGNAVTDPATPHKLSFGPNGTLNTGAAVQVNQALAGGVAPLQIDIDYTGTSQYGADFIVTANRANGYAAGEQTNLAVEKDGSVYANYSNGQRMLQGQIALASFVNTDGLKNEDGTAWSETSASGAPLVGVPGAGSFGELRSGALENSNVDLTQQLVGLMEGQRNYQANTKVLSTNKELTQILFGAI